MAEKYMYDPEDFLNKSIDWKVNEKGDSSLEAHKRALGEVLEETPGLAQALKLQKNRRIEKWGKSGDNI